VCNNRRHNVSEGTFGIGRPDPAPAAPEGTGLPADTAAPEGTGLPADTAARRKTVVLLHYLGGKAARYLMPSVLSVKVQDRIVTHESILTG
jgi:hypothetical protein